MYKHKLFGRRPHHLLKSKGSFKIHTKSHKAGSGVHSYSNFHNPIDDYLLSLVNGVKHHMKISKKQKHKGAGALKKNYSDGRCCGSGGKAGLRFVR